MLIYSHKITSRLQYVVNLLAREWASKIVLTDKKEQFLLYMGPKLNYSDERIAGEGIWIKPTDLLFQKGINVVDPAVTIKEKSFYIFPGDGDIGFDVLAALFFVVTRYEEYQPHEKDEYGRYAHINSLAYKNGFLGRPLANEWMENLRKLLSIEVTSSFRFIPTYDIDEAWSYKHKSWWRSVGGAGRDLLKGNLLRYRERRKVLAGKMKDPYDSYDWMDSLHKDNPTLQPLYFFHVGASNGKYDKNNLPSDSHVQELIHCHSLRYRIGVHPSWRSGDEPGLLSHEKEQLERISGLKIVRSRQHFIRMNLPQTYQHILSVGIEEEYSMGYGSINGFRASMASPFYWYDITKEQETGLLVYPFCFMEANSFFEQKHSPVEALAELKYYREQVKKVNGTLITIWHNTFLGTDPLFNGWREIYREFVEGTSPGK